MKIKTSQGIVNLRQAQETDLYAFRELRLEALRNHPEAFSSDFAVNQAHPLTYWTDRLRALGDEGMIYFAVADDEFVGMCGIQLGYSPKTRHSAGIWGVYVRPEWRGLHIAEALIDVCIAWARPFGVELVKLAVVTTNTAAIRSYARSGFTVYGVEPQAIRLDGVNYSELLMVRQL